MSDPLIKLKELPEEELPFGMHDRIMNRVISTRFQGAFVTVLSLLFINLVIAGTFLIIRMVHNDIFSLVGFMAREFELSENYFSQFGAVLYQNIPTGLFLTVLLNIILIEYIMKIYFSFKSTGRMLLKKVN